MEAPQIDSSSISVINGEAFDLHNTYPAETLNKSREVLRILNTSQANIPFEESVAYKNTGLAYWRLANYDSSLYYQRKAISIAEDIKNDSLRAKIISNMALVYQEKGQYSLSLFNSFQAYSVFKKLEDELNVGIIANNIGSVYLLLDNYSQAQRFFEESLLIGEQIGNSLIVCGNYATLGEVHFYQGNDSLSLAYFDKAINYCGKNENYYYLSKAHFHLGELYISKGKTQNGTQSFRRALNIQKNIGDKKGQANTMNAMAKMYVENRNFNQAVNSLQQVLEIAQENNLIFTMLEYYRTQIAYDSLTNNYQGAMRNFLSYSTLKDSLLNLQEVSELADVISTYENEALITEKTIQSEIIKRQDAQSRLIYGVLFFTFLAIAILGYSIRLKTRANKKLSLLNERISSQKLAIENQSKALVKANEETDEKNQQLSFTLEKLKEAQDRLIESEKMASLGLISAGLGHEINNPLNYIKGGVRGLKDYLKEHANSEDNTINTFVKIINEGVNRSTQLIQNLASFSTSKSFKSELCDIHDVIDSNLKIFETEFASGIELKKAYTHDDVLILGDKNRIYQVFANIFKNAFQSIKETGTLSVETETQGSNIKIIISDTGVGISSKDLKKVMDPFFTTKPPGEGYGLGLSICYRIIKEHHGEITIDSKLGTGTKIEITLPLFQIEETAKIN